MEKQKDRKNKTQNGKWQCKGESPSSERERERATAIAEGSPSAYGYRSLPIYHNLLLNFDIQLPLNAILFNLDIKSLS